MSLELFSLDNIQEIARQYGYWAVFLGIALENTGIPLPGETITVVGGFLAGSGELKYWLVLGSAISGAVLGDNFGYWIGRIGGWPFLLKVGSIFRIQEKQLEEGRNKFKKNAESAVFFGRFIALLRILAGPMAGVAEMPYGRFLLCNFSGAALWGFIMVSISFFLGKLVPLSQIVHWISQFGLVLLLLIILGFILTTWWQSQSVTSDQ